MSIRNEGKAAIVSTLGPASSDPEVFSEMVRVGLDVVRLNLSHGTHDDHKKRFEMVRDVDDSIPILLDLSGPKIRIGKLKESVRLKVGDHLTIAKGDFIGDQTRVSVSYPDIVNQATVGSTLFVNDGLIELQVINQKKDEIVCEVKAGGSMSSRKGVNAPGVPIKLYVPTDKDINDLEQTIALEPEFYSVSFVRRVEDLQKVRQVIAQHTKNQIPLVSKIEHQDALDNIDEIMKETDSIMVARGDLGVELPPQDIPLIQRQLVKQCNAIGKPCIVATQMLESMVISSKPTRAEASDVATAILQGADAVMLSAETATGAHPVESIDIMEKIITKVQTQIPVRTENSSMISRDISSSVGKAAVSLATELDTDVIIAFTRTGASSLCVAQNRPKQPIIAITPLLETSRRARLFWGVKPLLLKRDFVDTDEMIYNGIKLAVDKGYVGKDDTAVIVAGSLLGLSYSTNLIQLYKINDIIHSIDASTKFAQAYSLDYKKVNR